MQYYHRRNAGMSEYDGGHARNEEKMINTSIAQKMRQIAGYIYGALFIFEVLTLYYVLIGMALTGVPLAVLVELLVLPLARRGDWHGPDGGV